MNEDELGRVAYSAYCKAVGWKSVRGEDLPVWQDQAQHIRDAWVAAGNAVEDHLRVAEHRAPLHETDDGDGQV